MLRAAVYPLVAVVVLALAFLLVGPKHALGALVSGVAVVAGSALAAWVGLGGGIQAAGSAMVRLFVGFLLKIVLIVAVLGMAFFLVATSSFGAAGSNSSGADVPGSGSGQALIHS